jgi:hypothetical protein
MAEKKGNRIVCVNNGGKPCSNGCDEFHACPYKSRPVAAPTQTKDTEIERLKNRVQELKGFLESIRDFDEPYIDKTHTIQLMISLAKRAIQTALKEDQ